MAGFFNPFFPLAPNIHPHWYNAQHLDPGLGGQPRLPPDARRPWKPGQSKAAWIWPRDKKMGGTPLGSKQRWKDLLGRKGPAMFIGNRTKYGPTRNTWSNWNDDYGIFDNLGYENDYAQCMTSPERWKGKSYDFRTRKYTSKWDQPGVWSDVKYGRGGDPVYCRDFIGGEHTLRCPNLPHWQDVEENPGYWQYGMVNDFAYNPGTGYLDWQRPDPAFFWQNYLDLD